MSVGRDEGAGAGSAGADWQLLTLLAATCFSMKALARPAMSNRPTGKEEAICWACAAPMREPPEGVKGCLRYHAHQNMVVEAVHGHHAPCHEPRPPDPELNTNTHNSAL